MPGMAKTGSGATTVWVNDAFGSLTQAFDTVIQRVIPPRAGARAICYGFLYRSGATAHTVTIFTSMAKVSATSDAASGQAVVAVNSVPTATDGSALASGDYFIVRHEDYTYGVYAYSSISGLNITMTGNFTQKIKEGSPIYLMGAAADHATNRAFLTVASTDFLVGGGDFRNCAGAATGLDEPLLIHSNNATAAGNLKWVAYGYDS